MLRIRKYGAICAIALGTAPSGAFAFCSPPIPPEPTSEALAREYEPEFRQDFERYFSDTTAYFQCLDDERRRVLIEAEETAQRYDRFLADAEQW